VVVIWALALLAAIAASLTSATRTAALIAANGVDNAQAEALADAGERLAMLGLGRFYANPGEVAAVAIDGSERRCTIAGLGTVTLAIASETGKVDLNTASNALLIRLLTAVGGKSVNAAALADHIADFRDADGLRRLNGAEAEDYVRAGQIAGPKNAPFAAVEELGAVLGISPELASLLRPLVTVHSGATGVDPRLASREMIGLLSTPFAARVASAPSLPGTLPSDLIAISAPNVFLIRADAVTPAGARFVREAIVEIADAKRQRIEIRRWYRGDVREQPDERPKASNPGPIPAC
jgi:general secretion pathway protein K